MVVAPPELPVSGTGDLPKAFDLGQASSSASWLVVQGHRCKDCLPLAELCGGPCLFVVEDPTQEEQLRDDCLQTWPKHWKIEARLVGAESKLVAFHSYNDARYNGAGLLRSRQESPPNLRHIGTELREQVLFGDVLDDWEPSHADGGMLLLTGDRSLSITGAVGLRFGRLSTLGILAKSCPQEPLDLTDTLSDALRSYCLISHGLAQFSGLGPFAVWGRDAHLYFQQTVVQERDALRLECDALRHVVSSQEERLHLVNLEIDKILALMVSDDSSSASCAE